MLQSLEDLQVTVEFDGEDPRSVEGAIQAGEPAINASDRLSRQRTGRGGRRWTQGRMPGEHSRAGG
jgi:hypothetical protein